MKDLSWVKDLVRAEQQMEEAGMVDFTAGFDPEKTIHDESVHFLNSLKESFIEYASAFNQLRGLAVGGIKIYGISKTEADFMLFRNGFKLIFSLKQPGVIGVSFQSQGVGFVPGTATVDKTTTNIIDEDLIEAHWGAYHEIVWTHDKLPIKLEFLVRHYMTRFTRESAR